MGEDLASLISDDINYDNFEAYCQKLIPAYYKGISEYINIADINQKFVREMILIKFGYRLVQNFIFADDDAEREEAENALQKIFDMEY